MMNGKKKQLFSVEMSWSPMPEGQLRLKIRITERNAEPTEPVEASRLFELQLWRGQRLRDRQWLACSESLATNPETFEFRIHQSSCNVGARPRLRAIVLLNRHVIHESEAPEESVRADQQGRLLGDRMESRTMGEQTRMWMDDEFLSLFDDS